MKLIFVAGLPDIDKATIIDLALQRAGRKQEFLLVDFDAIEDIVQDAAEADDMEASRLMLSKFYDKTEKALIAKLKEQRGSIMVNGYLTFGTKYGYARGATDDFFRTFNPDIIVILERYAETGEKTDASTVDHQRINRYYGTIFSSMCGSSLKIIKFRESRMMEAVAELADILKH